MLRGVFKGLLACLSAGGLVLYSIAPWRVAASQERPGRPPSFPVMRLDSPLRGAAAVDALRPRLAEIAAWYGKTAAELEGIVAGDADAWADRNGQLFHACTFGSTTHNAPPAEAAPAGSPSDTESIEQTFALHSRSGSTKTIYLDFNGHSTSDTLWNQLAGRESIITPAFDTDGNPSHFSISELNQIQAIWRRVVEDFAFFDVDITTHEPEPDGIGRESTVDNIYGTRIVIGGSALDWYGQSAGGVSYIGSFDWLQHVPSFVFEEQLGNGNERYTAEAISHEVGHTLGLFHDGQIGGSPYYEGHGNWAPIMGLSYSKELTQWSKGEYSQANNTEDDLAVMASHGLAYLGDDHGDLLNSATTLSSSSPSASGVIERDADVDVFSFTSGASKITFAINVAVSNPNLDVQASLHSTSGSTIATSNGPGLATVLSVTIPAGTYFLKIEGAGSGDPVTGYSGYGSLGRYSLSGTIGASAQPPIARATADRVSGVAPLEVAFSSGGSADPDGTIVDYKWSFGDGSTSIAPNPLYTYYKAGTYIAMLTVTDKDGLTAREHLTIRVSPPEKQSPSAIVSADPTSGIAPLTTRFSGATSFDPDGSIATYAWQFGNGATSSEINPAYTYAVPGLYTASLTVTDSDGLQKTATVNITVGVDPDNVVFVSDITATIRPTRLETITGRTAMAQVTISDSSGAVRPGAIVIGRWSGVASGSVSGVTDRYGRVAFYSRSSKQNGSFVFTVTSVSARGYAYDESRNAKTSESVLNR